MDVDTVIEELNKFVGKQTKSTRDFWILQGILTMIEELHSIRQKHGQDKHGKGKKKKLTEGDKLRLGIKQ